MEWIQNAENIISELAKSIKTKNFPDPVATYAN